MGQGVLSGLVIVTGLVALRYSMTSAMKSLRTATRAYHRNASMFPVTPDGWDDWFQSGFSSMTVGSRWLRALAIWAVWTLAGVGLISLGFQLISRLSIW